MECDYGTCNVIMGPWNINRGIVEFEYVTVECY